MTAISDEVLNQSTDNSSSVRTGTSNFPINNLDKAATERTGGDNKMNLKQLLFGFNRFYNTKIYPQIKNVRGSYFVKRNLRNLALKPVDRSAETLSQLDWQNLIILDGCRYDTFQKKICTDTESRISYGSSSKEFIEGNFSNENFEDTVVITANPYYTPDYFESLTGNKLKEIFHTVFQVHETNWDQDLSTVKPEDVVEKALTARKLFPEKRLLIHFMQPHYPFIGEKQVEGSGIRVKDGWTDGKTAWDLAEEGKIDRSDVVEAYESNLEYVWQQVENLATELDRDVVITADHGNWIGENGFYGHPKGFDDVGLRKVPLAKFDCSDVKKGGLK